METKKQPLNAESSAVQTHLRMMQDVIARMASNSASCKTWCVTLVAAVLVLVARLENAEYAFFALVPIINFAILDAYYLALERGFRDSYNDFVSKLRSGELQENYLYVIERMHGGRNAYLASCCSHSIWPFYLVMVTLTVVAWLLLQG